MAYPYPILFNIGNLSVFTFGLFMLVAFLSSLWLALKRSKNKIEEDHIYNVSIISLVAGLIGSRIAFILFNPQYFTNFYDLISIWNGGMSFFGGFILALFSVFLYSKKKKIRYSLLLDIFAPSIALGVAITRIGGFLSGANPGIPTNLGWGVFDLGALRHPVALYHSISNFIILFVLVYFSKSKFKNNFKEGYLFLTYLVLFGIERLINDFFRFYESFNNILASRIIPLILIGVGLFFLFKLKKVTLEKTDLKK